MGGQVVDTHRQGERNRARTAKARPRVHLVVPAPPSAGRSFLESLHTVLLEFFTQPVYLYRSTVEASLQVVDSRIFLVQRFLHDIQ